MTINKLTRMPYAQAHVEIGENTVLVSYTTVVCIIDPNGWLKCTGTYSQTTRKHITAFIREYAPNLSYYDAKYCYEHSCEMNIHTREVREIPAV